LPVHATSGLALGGTAAGQHPTSLCLDDDVARTVTAISACARAQGAIRCSNLFAQIRANRRKIVSAILATRDYLVDRRTGRPRCEGSERKFEWQEQCVDKNEDTRVEFTRRTVLEAAHGAQFSPTTAFPRQARRSNSRSTVECIT
jgi:hypothetical protein